MFRRFRRRTLRGARRRRRSEMWFFRDARVPLYISPVENAAQVLVNPSPDDPCISAYRILGARSLRLSQVGGGEQMSKDYVGPEAAGVVFAGGHLTFRYCMARELQPAAFADVIDRIDFLTCLVILRETVVRATGNVQPVEFPILSGLQQTSWTATDKEQIDTGYRMLGHWFHSLVFNGMNHNASAGYYPDPQLTMPMTGVDAVRVKAKARVPENFGLYLVTYMWCGADLLSAGQSFQAAEDVFFNFAVHDYRGGPRL